jgi:hypothetical protein
VSAFGGFAVANLNTGFKDRVVDSLPTAQGSIPREPTQSDATASMTKITQALGGQLEFTPFTGKYSLFGKLFAHYDFYAYLGGAALNVQPTANGLPPCDGSTGRSCAVSGFKAGPTFGVGFHSYFNDWFGLNVELRDIIAPMNPSGRDVNGDGVANNDDTTWSSTYMVGANLVIYLPSTAAISP